MTDNTEAAQDIGIAIRETDKEHCEENTVSRSIDNDGSYVGCADIQQVI